MCVLFAHREHVVLCPSVCVVSLKSQLEKVRAEYDELSTNTQSSSKTTIQNLQVELARAEKSLLEARGELEEAQKKVIAVRDETRAQMDEELNALRCKMEADKARLEADNTDLRGEVSKMTISLERGNAAFDQLRKDMLAEERKRERDLATRWEIQMTDMARM